MIEVEIRAKIKNLEEIKKKLKKIGAKFVKRGKQIDRIFGHPMFLDNNMMIIEGGLSARIRETNTGILLEFKEIVRQKGAGLEISSKLDDVDTGLEFFKKLKFEEAFTIAKTRETYSYQGFEICLDKVKKLGNFIEIEKMIRSSGQKEKARKECLTLLKKLAPQAKIEPRKYGDLMQEIINKK